jgi:hypothetical protein
MNGVDVFCIYSISKNEPPEQSETPEARKSSQKPAFACLAE